MPEIASNDVPIIEPLQGPAASRAPAPVIQRNIAVDAYRGLVMLLMMAEVLHFVVWHKPFLETGSGAFLLTTRPTWSGPAVHCMT